jgi:hypothetical protein
MMNRKKDGRRSWKIEGQKTRKRKRKEVMMMN